MKRTTQFLKRISPTFLTTLFALLGITAFGQDKGDKTYIKTTEKGTVYQLAGWETNVVYNPDTYTWTSWDEPVISKEVVETTTMVPVSEFDRPPVFDGYCLTVDDKFDCANRKLQEYIQERAIQYPEQARALGQEGLEYVTFIINEKGQFEGNMSVASKDKPCKGCADAAADIVAGMENKWFPAIKDGKAVKTHLTVPIRFSLHEKQSWQGYNKQ